MNDAALKQCLRCKSEFPLARFFRNSWRPDKLTAYCKACVGAVSRSWDRRHPEKRRCYALKRRYGISSEAFQALFEKQNGACAICLVPFRSAPGGHVDHDHKTGVVRGLLCGSCNRALGLFGDNPWRLRTAARYLLDARE